MLAIQKEIRSHNSPEKAEGSMRFFKTKKGEYGAGDIFLGLTVPLCRNISKKYGDMKRRDVLHLLSSRYHEERLVALFIMIIQYQKTGNTTIVADYLQHTQYVNNWDLVDTSAYKLLGVYLRDVVKSDVKVMRMLKELAKSTNMWEQRIAIVATFAFIQKGKGKYTYMISDILLSHTHDLIHKAVGWMLRECGKKVSEQELIEYLKKNEKNMSRTTWRYARERLGK
jgi:3-methyladenine DNA glycosylase AlkD